MSDTLPELDEYSGMSARDIYRWREPRDMTGAPSHSPALDAPIRSLEQCLAEMLDELDWLPLRHPKRGPLITRICNIEAQIHARHVASVDDGGEDDTL